MSDIEWSPLHILQFSFLLPLWSSPQPQDSAVVFFCLKSTGICVFPLCVAGSPFLGEGVANLLTHLFSTDPVVMSRGVKYCKHFFCH